MKPTDKGTFFMRVLNSLPLLFSAAALALSFLSFNLTDVRSVKPVLTIDYRGESGWFLKNVGSGPALNVIVAVRADEDWFKPVRIAALAIGEEHSLKWLGRTNIKTIGAMYADIDGRQYTSLTSEDLTSIKRGNLLHKWPEAEIEKEWKLEYSSR